MDNVVMLPCVTTLPIPVERVLEGAKDCDYVLVLGWKGDVMHTACSDADLQRAIYLATKFIHKVHAGDYDE